MDRFNARLHEFKVALDAAAVTEVQRVQRLLLLQHTKCHDLTMSDENPLSSDDEYQLPPISELYGDDDAGADAMPPLRSGGGSEPTTPLVWPIAATQADAARERLCTAVNQFIHQYGNANPQGVGLLGIRLTFDNWPLPTTHMVFAYNE